MVGLSPRALRIAKALTSALFDNGREPISAERLDWFAAELGDYAVRAGPRTANGLTVIFTLLQLLPLLVIGKLARFTSLSREDRIRYLHKVETSPLLAPLVATSKIACALIYFEHPETLAEAGVTIGCLHPPKEPVALRPPGGTP